VLRVVASMNSAVIRALRAPAFQAVGVAERVVATAADALRFVRAEKPALVVLDVDLPDRSGAELCAEIKRERGHTLVILIAGRELSPAERDAGADAILLAPLPDGELYAQAARLLDLPPPRLRPEEQLAPWQIADRQGGLAVTLRGDLTERTDLAPLLQRIPRGSVSLAFDMSGIRYMNSVGLKRWLDFLGGLDAGARYTFVRCSVPFVHQVGLLPLAQGKGTISSFFAPLRCRSCDRETQIHLTTDGLPDPPVVPSGDCPDCGGRTQLDDIPDRFFAFLQP
jgi:CheY-like chemotaxis protein